MKKRNRDKFCKIMTKPKTDLYLKNYDKIFKRGKDGKNNN